MVRIECDVWEQTQLIEYLNYSKKKIKEDYDSGVINDKCLEYENSKIDNLIKIVKGKEYDGYLLKAKAIRRNQYSRDSDEISDAEREIMRLPYIDI